MHFVFGTGYCQPILRDGCPHQTKRCPQHRLKGKDKGITRENAYRGVNVALEGPTCNRYGRGGRRKLRPASILAAIIVKELYPLSS